MKKSKRQRYVPLSIEGKKLQDFAEWLNTWGDCDKDFRKLDDGRKLSKFGEGYHEAISHVFKKLEFKLQTYDNRRKEKWASKEAEADDKR